MAVLPSQAVLYQRSPQLFSLAGFLCSPWTGGESAGLREREEAVTEEATPPKKPPVPLEKGPVEPLRLRPHPVACFGGCRFDCASCPSTRRGCLLGRAVSEVKVGEQEGEWYKHDSETWVRMGLDDGLGKDLVI